jgi:putative membrane protein
MKKLLANDINTHAKTKRALALCTVLALASTTLLAQQQQQQGKGYDNDKGVPGKETQTQTGKAGQFSRGDEKFLKDACRGGRMEVQMGNLGVQKAQNPQVKEYAQRLIDDHTKANSELKQLALNKGLTFPDTDSVAEATDVTDADRTRVRERNDAEKDAKGEHKEHAGLKKLEGLSGAEFDREFVRMAVKDHEKDISEFEKVSQKSEDSEVRAFAAKALPTLREHLQQAKNLQSEIGTSSDTIK